MHEDDERTTASVADARAHGPYARMWSGTGRAEPGRVLLTLCAALVIGVAGAGCGGDEGGDSGSEQAPQNGTTQLASPQASPAGTAAQEKPGGSSETVGQIPIYKPSTTVSEWASGAVLASQDSVSKVGRFYVDWVEKSGWDIVSKSVTPYSTSLVIKKGRKGASISVSSGTRGATTGVSISVYPT